MAKKGKRKEYTTEKVIDSLNQTAYKAENFFEKNSKVIIGVLGVLAILAIGYFVYLKTVLEPKSEKAFAEMVQADEYLKQDSALLALKGSPGSFQGYEQIINNYGNTKAGNLAKYKAGAAYYKLGDFASAVKTLESFKTDDENLRAMKNGLIGDALVDSDKMEEGLKYYVTAAKGTEVEAIQALYYTKAGKLAFQIGKNEEALKYFQFLADTYPNSVDMDVKKFIERLKYATSGD